jgi:gas vesicle protein
MPPREAARRWRDPRTTGEGSVRIRTLFTFGTGAAVGASAMYLLDPEHGLERRRQARRTAAAQAREGAVRAAAEARRRAEEVAVSAVAGFQEARTDGGQDASPAER